MRDFKGIVRRSLPPRSGIGRTGLNGSGAGNPVMAYVTEVDSKFVGMFFRLRKVLQGVASGGFVHATVGGGAMATRAKRDTTARRPSAP